MGTVVANLGVQIEEAGRKLNCLMASTLLDKYKMKSYVCRARSGPCHFLAFPLLFPLATPDLQFLKWASCLWNFQHAMLAA